METLKELINEIARNNPNSTLHISLCTCCECRGPFEAVCAVDDNGEIVRPQLCNQCQGALALERAICPSCGAVREVAYIPTRNESVYQCRQCAKPEDFAEYKAARYAQRWQELCPSHYRFFSLEKACKLRTPQGAEIVKQRYNTVMNWSASGLEAKGLLLKGASGEMKTFFAYEKVKQLIFQGYTVSVFECNRLANTISAKFSESASAGQLFVDSLMLPDVILIDDFGKSAIESASGRFLAEFFALVERRAARHKPMIITTNETSETITGKIKDVATATALVRRLSQFYNVYTFEQTELNGYEV